MTPGPRPLSVGDILDGSFTLYRRNFAAFLAIALIPQLPLLVMWLTVPALLGGSETGGPAVDMLALLATPYSLVATTVVWAGLAFATMRAYEGVGPKSGEALMTGLKKLIPIAVAGVIAFTAVLIGSILFIIPGLIFAAMFFAFLHAIVIEGRGPLEALGRSRRLSKGGRLRILGVSFLAYCIVAVPTFALIAVVGVAGGVGVAAAGAESAATLGFLDGLLQAASIGISVLTMPFTVAVLTLLYLDRRARTEAPDLEAAAERLATIG